MALDITQYDCIYCGMNAKARDHVIPFSYNNYTGIRTSSDYPLEEIVPACTECNSMLSNRMLTTIASRAEYISNAIARKYRKALTSPEWTPEEFDELGRALKSQVRKLQSEKKIAKLRIEYAKERAKLIELTPIAYWEHVGLL